MADIGFRLGAASLATIPASGSSYQQRAAIDEAFVAPSGGWLTGLFIWARAVSGAPVVTLSVWKVGDSGAPTDLLARANAVPVPFGTGALIESAIEWTNPGLLGGNATNCPVLAGQKLALGWELHGGDIEVGFPNNGTTATWFYQQNATRLPTNPFVATLTQSAGVPAVGAVHVPSTPPQAFPSTPVSGATLTTDDPVFTGTFFDAETGRGDGFASIQFELRAAGATVLTWGGGAALFTIPPAQRTSPNFLINYSGPPLAGGAYEYRLRVSDVSGLWSGFTAWVPFTVALSSGIDVSTGAPAGKIEQVSGTIWSARWWHSLGHAMNAAQVRVTFNGQPFYESLVVPVTVAGGAVAPPGTAFSVAAESLGVFQLTPGATYAWSMRGRSAVNGLWSPWSAETLFRLNALPTQPVLLQPPWATAASSPPVLEFASYDTDPEDVPLVDVAWEVELKKGLTGTPTVRLATGYDGARRVGSLALTAAMLAGNGDYYWRVRGQDVSAGAAGYSPWSDFSSFTLAGNQEVVVTNPMPGEVKDGPSFRTAWTVANQKAATVSLFFADTTTLVTSFSVAGDQRFADIPPGWLLDGGSYDLMVTVLGVDNGSSNSLRVPFSVDFTPPLALDDVDGTVIRMPRDFEPTTVRVVWGRTTLGTQFGDYLVERSVLNSGVYTAVAKIANPNQLFWDDHHAPPGAPMVYAVYQRTAAGYASLSASVVVTVNLETPVLAAIDAGDSHRFACGWLGGGAIKGGFQRRRSAQTTWGAGGLPTVFAGKGGRRTLTISTTLRADERGTLAEHLADAERVGTSGKHVSYRDAAHRWWMEVEDFTWGRGSRVGEIDVAFKLAEIAYREGA